METYVDGFVLPVPKDKIDAYRRVAEIAGAVWKEHGALEYRECVGDDLDVKEQVPFPTMAKTEENETVVLAWIIYKSRADRDAVNAKVMADPRMKEACEKENVPFDFKRMAYGGFRMLVDL